MCSWILALLTACWASGAAAQSPDDAARAEARTHVAAAVEAFAGDAYQQALDEFRAAFELAPVVELRFNIALCLERLGRLVEAEEAYQAALDSGELNDEGWARATEQLAALAPRIGTLSFTGSEGRTIALDGDRHCDVPCTLRVDPGVHHWSAPGLETAPIDARPGETVEIVVPPEPVTAPLAEPGYQPGWLFWLGGGTALAGAAGIIGFGLHSNDLHARFELQPTGQLASDGTLVTALANASIGVAAGGALLLVLDIALGGTD